MTSCAGASRSSTPTSARLEVDAGVVNLPAVTETLTRVLGERGVQTVEGVETTAVERDGEALRVITDAGSSSRARSS